MSVNTKINGQLVKSASLTKAIVPVGLGDCYSTEERQVGVWTDGKPLYQKTIDFGALPNSTTKEVAHGISDVTADSFVDFKGIGIYPNNYATPLPKIHDGSFGGQCFFEITATTVKCYSRSGNLSVISKCYITLQYTKTTDTAGSGIWTPSGSYAVHYSTDEQVIGTWTDGKPIYRITLPEVSFGTTDVTYTHNLGIKQYIKVYGSCQINGTTYPIAFPFYQHKWSHFCELNNYYEDRIVFSSDWNNNKAIVTLEYTKIADYT